MSKVFQEKPQWHHQREEARGLHAHFGHRIRGLRLRGFPLRTVEMSSGCAGSSARL